MCGTWQSIPGAFGVPPQPVTARRIFDLVVQIRVQEEAAFSRARFGSEPLRIRLDELNFSRVRYQLRLSGLAEQPAHRLPACRAVVQRPLVDVHPHEPIGQGNSHVAGVVQGVVDRLAAVLEGVADRPQKYGADRLEVRAQITADGRKHRLGNFASEAAAKLMFCPTNIR